MSVSAQITVSTKPVQTASNPLGTFTGSPQIVYQVSLSTSQIGQCYGNTRTISGTSETLSVISGLTDQFGTAIDLATLQVLQIENLSETLTLTVGGGTDSVLGSDVYTIGPGNCLYIDPSRTTSSTVQNILVSASGSGCEYSIIILGS